MFVEQEEVLNFTNLDISSVKTPVKVDILANLLRESGFDAQKTQALIQGFSQGFDIGYRGPVIVQKLSPNLKLRVGNETILWNKVMKEVGEGRFAGPFKQIPFSNHIQSPIGLVPKDKTNTRLIFHLSYPRAGDSVNSQTPKEWCSVNYPSIDDAIQRCLQECDILCETDPDSSSPIYMGKSDWKSAFCNLGIRPDQFCYLVLKARSPLDKQWYFFVDKCLPFGASISCAIFQSFSDAMAHILTFKAGRVPINYLDDFLFLAMLRKLCNDQIRLFLRICEEINFPVAMEKPEWASTRIVFLGLLIDA